MPIQQTKKQSDLEKRLQLLRKQVYGQQSAAGSKYNVVREKQENTHTTNTDISYLRQDLTKILFLSSLAIGTQIILFFLLKNQIIKINIF